MATKKANTVQPFCRWTEDYDGAWETDCGQSYMFDEGGPAENGQKFCGYCGKPLREVPVKGGR